MPDANALIEAVPNFSEGRNLEVIDAIAQAIQAPGVHLLHRTSDPDHNRTVLTIAGPPEPVLAGLLQAIATAAGRISLAAHQGVHPRIGATDVVPLVPVANTSLDECAEWARTLGRRIGEELHLPVYLYEAAALLPERRNLADVRRGGYEALRHAINRDPAKRPDFGPAKLGPAGAVAVGARPFLIAYNVFLTTSDVTVAENIADAIRERDGGLPAVKALGLLVDGQAQVSMNLVDFTVTPPHVVFDRIRELAAQVGASIDRSELIGLIPQEAIYQAAAHYLKLPGFSAEDTVEEALRRARLL